MFSKRFPATISQTEMTFINNKKIDGELYALLQEYSYPDQGITKVNKKKFLTQQQICNKLGLKSTKTVRTHMSILIDNGYVVPEDEYYILPNCEDIYMLIPFDTLKYLNTNCKEHVIKIYLYLGQRYKFAESIGKQYDFTLEEIGDRLGLSARNHSDILNKIKYALEILWNSGLINYEIRQEGVYTRHILTEWNFEYNKKNQEEKNDIQELI